MAAAAAIRPLQDTSELVELYKPLSLYLKPLARIMISVVLPQLKDPGQSISNWDLMERIKKMVHPIQFSSIRVVKSTIEFVRFEADVDNRQVLSKVIKTLDGSSVKVIGFYETLRVKAAEAKSDFATKYDWDSFFRDAKNMNELRPGERPDTVYLANIPCKWFQKTEAGEADATKADGQDVDEEEDSKDPSLPNERIFRKAFEGFGEVRCCDIPICDKWRKDMSKTGLRTVGFSFGGDLTFEGYVQFVEYIGFARMMDAFRNMTMVKFDKFGKAHQAQIKVDFDRSKHLSDKNIRRRRLERERLVEIERTRIEEEERRRIEEEQQRKELEVVKTDRRRQREEKRRIRRLEQKRAAEERNLERMIRTEERKLLIAQRKLESRRMLNELVQRVHLNKKSSSEDSLSPLNDKQLGDGGESKKEAEERRKLERKEKKLRQNLLDDKEKQLREKIKNNVALKKRNTKKKVKKGDKQKKKGKKKRSGGGGGKRPKIKREPSSSEEDSSSSGSDSGEIISPRKELARGASGSGSEDGEDRRSLVSVSSESSSASARTWSSGDDDGGRIKVFRMSTRKKRYYSPSRFIEKRKRKFGSIPPEDIPGRTSSRPRSPTPPMSKSSSQPVLSSAVVMPPRYPSKVKKWTESVEIVPKEKGRRRAYIQPPTIASSISKPGVVDVENDNDARKSLEKSPASEGEIVSDGS